MKNIILKSAIALVLLLTGTAYQSSAHANTEAKEAITESQVNQATESKSEAGVKSRIRIRDGKMSYILGIPLGSSYSTDFELKDRKGNVIRNGSLQASKVIIFNSDNLDKGTYELIIGGKLYQEVTID